MLLLRNYRHGPAAARVLDLLDSLYWLEGRLSLLKDLEWEDTDGLRHRNPSLANVLSLDLPSWLHVVYDLLPDAAI